MSNDVGITVLTASRRLAHALRLRHAQDAQAQGLSVWRTPRILPWSAWLRQQWQDNRATVPGQHGQRLLSTAQTRVMWHDIVASSDAGAQLLVPAGAARLAARSWQRMQDYLIPADSLAASDSAETQALWGWCAQFERRCLALQALDESRLAHWAHEYGLVPAEPLALAGFDIVPPAMQRLFDRWQAQGKLAPLAPWQGQLPPGASKVEVFAARDRDAELTFAARWARAQLERGSLSIGVVIPDLQTRRGSVKRAFEDVFSPGQRAISADPDNLPVSIAASQPLASYPLVEAAMLALQFSLPDRSSAEAGRLLRSAFLAAADSERDRRALADCKLRDDQRDRWDWLELEHWAGGVQCERLQLAARNAATLMREGTSPTRPSHWAERFHSWLKAIGWPGERTLSSVEHQTLHKFQAALAEFGTLDAVASQFTLRDALARLQELLRDTPFEPEAQVSAVTVIDPTTMAGMQFDALWVAGLDAASLPGPVTPDPLLPLIAQRDAGVPEASAEGVMRQARIRLQRWTHSARSVVLSWPAQEGEAILQPSPLLAPWTEAEALPLAAVRPWRRTLFDVRPRLEEVLDRHAPALPSSAARGGAMTLELQSRCPFRAQAQLRLHALALPQVSLGVQPMDRGTILHRVLADVWQSLVTQQALVALDETALHERVRASAERHVAQALRPAVRYRTRLAMLESDNITALVLRLLALEKQRPSFAVRFAEASEPYVIGGLAITLQPDRIDDLEGGGQLLIDYKLGDSHQPRQWLDAWPGRPRRPQLPLYALAHEQSLSALAFVVLAAGTVEYRGWSDGAAVGAGVRSYPEGMRLPGGAPEDWTALLPHWRSTLTELAERFVAGDAAVDPLPQECTYCHLGALCRRHEHPRFEEELGNDD